MLKYVVQNIGHKNIKNMLKYVVQNIGHKNIKNMLKYVVQNSMFLYELSIITVYDPPCLSDFANWKCKTLQKYKLFTTL